VAIQLVAEVLDHAPPDLTHGEVRLLVCLAEWADKDTRQCWPGKEAVQRRMKAATWDPVAKLLRSLAAKGYEVRVPIGADSSGRTVVAAKGRRTAYRIPCFTPRD